MKLRAKGNVDQVMRDFDALAAAIEIGSARAANTLASQARVAGFRRISEVYQIGPRMMDAYATVKLAASGDLEASITVKGKGFPLSAFAPVQTRRGVSVRIKRQRFLIPHAFISAKLGGRVYARGAYGGKGLRKASAERFGRFQFGISRLPINQLFTLGPSDAFSNPDVVDAMNERVEQQYAAVLKRELKQAVRTR